MRKINNLPRYTARGLDPRRVSRPARRGYLYGAVVISLALVSVLSMCAVKVARNQLRTATDGEDWQAARRLAQSGVELAVAVLNNDTSWKTKYLYGTEYPSPPLVHQGGRMAWKLTDRGGGDVQVDGVGRRGRATCVLSVTVQTPAASALEVAVCADRSLYVPSSSETLIAVGGRIATNSRLINLGTIEGNCEAQSLTGSSPASGSLTIPGPIRSLPDPQSVMAYYLANGTDVTAGMITTEDSKLKAALLSPDSNPYGSPNPQGIYIVDLTGGKKLTITSCRIVGTLVVKNASGGVSIIEDVNWEPAMPNYPAIIVQGPLTVMVHDGKVEEAKLGVNFNPTSTPWQGASDSLADDSYPSALAGLIYCSGTLTLDGKGSGYTLSHQGILMTAGGCVVDRTAKTSIQYEDVYFKNPPPGFGSFNAPQIEFGSWRQTPSY